MYTAKSKSKLIEMSFSNCRRSRLMELTGEPISLFIFELVESESRILKNEKNDINQKLFWNTIPKNEQG